MINQQSHISLQTAILEKLFNMCLPVTSKTLRKRYIREIDLSRSGHTDLNNM